MLSSIAPLHNSPTVLAPPLHDWPATNGQGRSQPKAFRKHFAVADIGPMRLECPALVLLLSPAVLNL